MRIGELAQHTGTTPKAIRLDEARGLMGTVARTGSYRHDEAADVARVLLIRQAQALGSDLLATSPGRTTWCGSTPSGEAPCPRCSRVLSTACCCRVTPSSTARAHRCGTQLLTGRSADLLVTMDSPHWYFRWVTHRPGHYPMKKAILEFCGIGPVRVHSFGPVRTAHAERLAQWVEKARQLGWRQGLRATPGTPRPARVTSSPPSPSP
ncbi:flavodoxin-like protein [Acidovorax sp. 69]|nr:flavodoxin-like protein [Acidovorax sp. 69]